MPVASASQHTLVDLVCALSTLQTESVLQLVKEVVKRPQQIKGDEVRCPREQAPETSLCLPSGRVTWGDPRASTGFSGWNVAVTVLWRGLPGVWCCCSEVRVA